jgi:hypothetical protein
VKKLRDTFLHHGGMMRCCTASIALYVDIHEDDEAVDGLTIPCEYEPPREGYTGGRLVLHQEGDRFVWRINLD